MLATGVELIEIGRTARTLEHFGERFLNRVYPRGELEYCSGRPSKLATRFAATEATMKALGTGLLGVGWKDIEITPSPGGTPGIRLHGRARDATPSTSACWKRH